MEDTKKILEMLAAGKISTAEAEQLLNALKKEPAAPKAGDAATTAAVPGSGSSSGKKFLRVEVKSNHRGKGAETVNVRVPFQLLRAGMKLTSLIPDHARGQVTHALSDHGINL